MGFKRFVNTDILSNMISSQSKFHLIDSRPGLLNSSIIGAKRLNLLDLTENPSQIPYLPTSEKFNKYLNALNIEPDDTPIVIYDSSTTRTAAKLWFTFKLFNKSNVSVLNGGFEKWANENRELSTNIQDTKPEIPLQDCQNENKDTKIPLEQAKFTKNTKLLKGFEYISTLADLLKEENPQTLSRVIDGRAALRFIGLAPEPNSAKQGNIDGSKNLPHTYLLNQDRTVKSKEEVFKILEKYNIRLDDTGNIVHFSGFGLSACYNLLILEEVGFTNQYLFDGGWNEWLLKDKPIEMPVSVKGILEEGYEKYLKKKNNKKL